MVEIIRKLAEDPLKKLDPPSQKEDIKEKNSHMKTKMLELTIYKISTLLQRGFGELGAQIIAESINEQAESELVPGKKVYAVFLMIRITQFSVITELLQEEIIVFVNKILRILHECAHHWEGAANKNYGDKYLITWILPEETNWQIGEMTFKLERKAKRLQAEMQGIPEIDKGAFELGGDLLGDDKSEIPKKKKKNKKQKKEEEEKRKKEEEERLRMLEEKKKREEEENKIVIDEPIQEKAVRALVTAIKVVSEINRAADLSAYANHPKLGPKYDMNFKPNLTCALHVGWLIEGAVGSEYKIDALYLSPAITVCSQIQKLAEDTYHSSIMMSEEFKYCLSQNALMPKFNRTIIEENENDIENEVKKKIIVSQQTVRMVDRVLIKCQGYPIDLYSFDVRMPEEELEVPEDRVLGDILVDPEQNEISESDLEKMHQFPLDYMFSFDEDIYQVQSHRVNTDFYGWYNEAIEAYIDGQWEYAIETFDKCLAIDPEDGPTLEMKRYLQVDYNSTPPENWQGYRNIGTSYSFNMNLFAEEEDESQQFEEDDEEASESEV